MRMATRAPAGASSRSPCWPASCFFSAALFGSCRSEPPYAVWTGIGGGGSVLMGVLLFGERFGMLKGTGIGLVILGIVVLKSAPA